MNTSRPAELRHRSRRVPASEPLELRRLLASIVVNSTADNAVAGDGLTTLREAIAAANNDSTTDTGQTGSGADQITFELGGAPREIRLVNALPSLDSDLSIAGAAPDQSVSIFRDSTNEFRIFAITAGRTVTLEFLGIFNGSVTTGSGGGVANFGGNVTIRTCSIQNNSARLGGGIVNISGGVVRVIDTSLSENVATFDGGGMYNLSGASATFDGGIIGNNRAQRWGGAAYGADSTLSFLNTWVFGNSTNDDAGGIDITQAGTLTLTDTLLSSNFAPDFGGAVRAGLDCTTRIERCRFESNLSAHGGAMFNRGLLEVTDTGFNFNQSTYGAGALDNDGGVETVTRCNFGFNFAQFGGGAMWNHVDSTATVIDCSFDWNSAGEGGAIANRDRGTLIVRGSRFFNNRSNSWGGAIFNNFGFVTVKDSTFYANTAYFDGGGINTNDGVVLVEGSTFHDNQAPRGGALYNHFGGEMRVTNSTIYRNGGNIGTGIFSHAQLELYHTTVADNWLFSGSGGPAVFNEFGTVLLNHSVVARNAGGDVIATDPAISKFFSFIGDVSGDPMLEPPLDNGGRTWTMRVLPGSPLINAGDPAFAAPPQFDQRGEGFVRVIGGRIDIGAFEHNATPTTAGLGDLTVPEDAADSVVNLRDFFDDVEDGRDGLVFTIVGNTNPGLFASAAIDGATGALTLDYAADANGVSDVTVRATDANGGYVEDTFAVTVLSALQQADLLAQRVRELPGLNSGQRTALLAKLNLNGNAGDAHKVRSFIGTVEVFAAVGLISASDAQHLISAAGDVLLSLG